MDSGELILWIFTSAIALGTLGASLFACSKGARSSFVYRDADAAPFQ
jgi:hypothetical protein